VVAAQLTNSGVDSAYIHNHLARAFFTRYNGNPLNYTLEQGRVIVKEFRFSNIPALWKLNDLKVICMVHEYGSSMKVLQAGGKKVL
jgi:hypothetical protein